MTQHKGKFIVVEGLEGAGKSSAIDIIKQWITLNQGHSPLCTREPGGTPIAEKIRTLVKESLEDDPLCDEAECLLIYAARVQLLNNVITPAMAKGQWVLGDRHDLSSLAYQGGGRGLMSLVNNLSQTLLGDRRPDLTLYLDIDPSIGLSRARSRGTLDRIERQQLDFFLRARQTYLQLTSEDDTIELIDASQSMEQVHRDILRVLQTRLGSQ